MVRSDARFASPRPARLFLAVALIAAVVRIVRGPKTHSGATMPMRPGDD